MGIDPTKQLVVTIGYMSTRLFGLGRVTDAMIGFFIIS